jgi:hypothetical protein
MIGENTNETLRPRPGDTQRSDLILTPDGVAADRPISVAFGPWRCAGSRPTVLRASFPVFRVKVCRGGPQVVVVVVAPRAIRSPGFNPHLGGNVERLVGVGEDNDGRW